MRPICNQCAKPLAKYTGFNFAATEEQLRATLPAGAVIIGKIKPGHHGVNCRYWAGHYGRRGNDRFCSYICAERWALKRTFQIFRKG